MFSINITERIGQFDFLSVTTLALPINPAISDSSANPSYLPADKSPMQLGVICELPGVHSIPSSKKPSFFWVFFCFVLTEEVPGAANLKHPPTPAIKQTKSKTILGKVNNLGLSLS